MKPTFSKAVTEWGRSGARASWLSALVATTFVFAQQPATKSDRKEVLDRLVGQIVNVPGGIFRMGGTGSTDAHVVTVKAFRLSKYEVTLGEYSAFLSDPAGGRLARPQDWDLGIPERERERPNLPDLRFSHDGEKDWASFPVVAVNWDETQSFIRWVNLRTSRRFRLPSEAEWEYAARGGSFTQFPWGDVFDSTRANGNRLVGKTTRVGTYPPNAFGIYDVVGNVLEWTADCWHDTYRGAPTNGTAWISGNCGLRVYRGFSWDFSLNEMSVSFRNSDRRARRDVHIGFRIAEDAP